MTKYRVLGTSEDKSAITPSVTAGSKYKALNPTGSKYKALNPVTIHTNPYESVKYNPDFAEKSKYTSDKSDLSKRFDFGNYAYHYLNDPDLYGDSGAFKGVGSAISDVVANLTTKNAALSEMTPDEIAVYNYYINTGDKDRANKYLESIEETLNRRKAGELAESAKDSPVKKAALSFVGGMEQGATGIQQVASRIAGNKEPVKGVYFTEAAQQASEGDTGVSKIVNDVIMGIGNMSNSLTIGTLTGSPIAGAALMGLQAAGSSYKESREQGYEDTESIIYGVTNGALEATLQYALGGIGAVGKGGLSKALAKIPALKPIAGKVDDILKSAIKSDTVRSALKIGGGYIAQMGDEAIEEWAQAVIDPVVRNIILDENNQFNPVSEEALYSGLIGALTAGILNVPSLFSRAGATDAPVPQVDTQQFAEGETALQGVTGQDSAYVAQGVPQAQDIPQNIPQATGTVDVDGVQTYTDEDVQEKRSYSLPQNEWEAAQRNVDSSVSEVRSLSDIVNAIRKAFNIPISTGKIRQRSTAGIYKGKSQSVRTQVSNAVPVIAHEVGHHIDNKYTVSSVPQIQEVKDYFNKEKPGFLDSYAPNKHNSEAFAEFMRLYLSDKQTAKQGMPNFYNEFVNAITSKGGTADMAHLEAIGDMVNAYMTGSKREQALSAITTRTEALKRVKSQQTLHEKAVRFRMNSDDFLFALKDISEETYNRAVESLDANMRIAKNVDGVFMNDINGNVVYKKDANGNITDEVMPSLAVVMENIPSAQSNNFTLYLVYKRALSWLDKGLRVFANDTLNDKSFILQEIADLEASNPNFADTAQQLYDWQKRFMEVWLVDNGIISREMFENLWQSDPNYVPFDRDISERASAKKKGFSSSVPIHRAKGSGLSIFNPVESIIFRVDRYINAAEINYIKQSLVEQMNKQDGLGYMVEPVPPTAVPNSVSTKDMKAKFEKALSNIDLSESDANAVINALDAVVGDDLTQFIVKGNQGEDILISFENGEKVYTQIHDKNLFNTFVALGGKQTRSILDYFGKVSRVVKTLTTGLNLIWAFTSNAPRDFAAGFKYSSTNNVFKYTADYFKSLASVVSAKTEGVRNAEPEIGGFNQYQAAGGGFSSRISNPKTLRTLMQNVIEHDKSGFRKMLENRVRILEGIETAADIVEQATRYAEYNRALKQGMTPRQAVRMADEVTVNFKKKGLLSQQIDKVIPYFNPAVQGLSRMGRAITEDTVPFITKTVATSGILAGIVIAWNYLFMDDEDEYEKLSTYNKNSYYCFSIGNGEFIKIPKDRELAALESLFERTLEHHVGQNDMAFTEFVSYIFNQFAPPGVPTPTEGIYPMVQDLVVIGDIAETMANRTFTGAPIVPAQYQDLLPEAQYDNRTSFLAKQIGQALGWSPMKIDHFITNNFGFLGKFNKALTAEDKDFALGFGNQIIGDAAYSQDATRVFYDEYNIKASTAKTYPDNGEYQAEYKLWNSVRSVLSEINKMARDPDNDERAYKILARDYAVDFLENQPDIDERLVKLYEQTKEGTVFYNREFKNEFTVDGKKVSLDINDFIQYVDDYNETADRLYDSVLSASGFTDEQKVKALKRIKEDVAESMKRKYVTKTESVGVVSAVEQGIPAETYLRVKLFASTDGNSGITQTEARAALDKTNLTQQQKAVMWTLINKDWVNNPYGRTSSTSTNTGTNWTAIWEGLLNGN